MTGKGRPFKCKACGLEGLSAISDEEATAEAEELFKGPIPAEEREVLCDPCYRSFLGWFNGLSAADHAAIEAGTYPTEKLFPVKP